ncbi:hypothetical protein EHM76_06895 [bacterium]|nr:MAG: hypothetical protein EHM76_06895 [bacterium]
MTFDVETGPRARLLAIELSNAPADVSEADLRKAADITGTELAPFSAEPVEDLEKAHELELGIKAVKTSPESLHKQAGEQMTSTQHFADVRNRRYPLNSLSDVEEAGRYMGKYASEIGPRERRSMALEIEKRASELGIPVPKVVSNLTQVKVASVRTIQGHLELRQDYYGHNSDAGRLFGVLRTKLAGMRPAVIAETIAAIDESHGGNHDWGRVIEDPWSVVFPKRAEEAANPTYDLGNQTVAGGDIERLAKMGLPFVSKRFGEEFATEFSKDPVGFYNHLPSPEKRVLSTMARESYVPPFVSSSKS